MYPFRDTTYWKNDKYHSVSQCFADQRSKQVHPTCDHTLICASDQKSEVALGLICTRELSNMKINNVEM